MECNYNNLYKGDFSMIKECFPNINFNIQIVRNQLDRHGYAWNVEKCYLLNNKKDSYYNITYDATAIIHKIESYNIDNDFKKKYIENLKKLMDYENNKKRENCCNCISFTYYSRYPPRLFDSDNYTDYDSHYYYLYEAYGYMASILQSVINVKKKLKDFICRIYLDTSLFTCVQSCKKFCNSQNSEDINIKNILELLINIENVINSIFTSENVEIYIFLCNSYAEYLEKPQLRSLRFLIMIDPEVSCAIIREADGIVTYLDCYNIKNFMKSKKIFFTYNLDKVRTFSNFNIDNLLTNYISNRTPENLEKLNQKLVLKPYSKWLETQQLIDEYFLTHSTLFNILAGTIGINIQISSEYFDGVFKLVKDVYNKYNEIRKIKKEYIEQVNDEEKFHKFVQAELKEGYTATKEDYLKHLNEMLDIYISRHLNTKLDPLELTELIENKPLLDTGFDEIFLMYLFRDIYTYEIKKDKIPMTDIIANDIYFIMKNIFIVKKKIYIMNNNRESIADIDKRLITVSENIFEFLKNQEFAHLHITNIVSKINDIKKLIYEGNKDLLEYKSDYDEVQRKNKNVLFNGLILSIFDLSIDSDYYNTDDCLDIAYNYDATKFMNLSGNLNFNASVYKASKLFFDLYNGVYGLFHTDGPMLVDNIDDSHMSERFKKKYLKYKQKYLQLKLTLL